MTSESFFSDFFSKSSTLHGNKNAVIIAGKAYTYAELKLYVDQVKEILNINKIHKQCLALESSVSIWSVASLIAIIETGNSFLPVNLEFPFERNKFILKESEPAVFLLFSDRSVDLKVISSFSDIMFIHVPSKKILNDKKILTAQESAGNTVYILFTSGSTGDPKGVPISYNNLFSFMSFFLDTHRYDFHSEDRFLQVYDMTFDVFYFSLLVPLCVGAPCYFLDPESSMPKYMQIIDCLKRYEITVVSMVPTTIMYAERFLNELQFPHVRWSFFSGDALYQTIAAKWNNCIPAGQIHNFYGPTETTIVCTRYIWDQEKSEKECASNDIVPLGIPFPGMSHVIVDDHDKPVKTGETGELCFSGSQVISRYMGDHHKEAFVNLTCKNLSSQFYKTGDLCYENPEGNLIFMGRKDFQCKINGYRVDLLEIEKYIHLLFKKPSAVIAKKDIFGFNYLHCFIENSSFSEKYMKEILSDMLPEYMIPVKFSSLHAIPLNPNGKIDKKALQNY